MACIVCKKVRIPFDGKQSFHKFPKDDDLKTKWMNAIGNFSIRKTSIICSDHFDAGSYHDTDGYTTLRRLLSTAVPRIKTNKEELLDGTNKFTETNDKTVSEYFQSTENHNDKIIEGNKISQSEKNTQNQVSERIVNVESVNLISQITVNNSNYKSYDAEAGYTYLTIDPLKTAENTPYNDLKLPNDEIIRQLHHQNNSGNSNNLERKSPRNESHHMQKKKINYRFNFKTYRFAREKFSSNEAWQEFQEFAASLKNKKAAVFRKNYRKQNKLKNLKIVVEKLKKTNEINVTEYLQVIYRET